MKGKLHRLVMVLATFAFPVMAQDGPAPQTQPSVLEKVSHKVKAALAAKPASAPAEEAADPPGDGADATSKPADAPPDIHVSPQGRVEMHVRDSELSTVLQMLSIQSQRNIVATNKVSGKVTANLYSVTFEEAMTAILDSNSCAWREQGNFIYVYTKDELKEVEAAARPRVSRLFRLRYSRAVDVEKMIVPLKSKDGEISLGPPAELGVAASSDKTGGDSMANNDCLLVIDDPEHLERIAKTIAEIDARPKQVMVEATIMRAQLTEDNALGIDFNLIGGVDFQGVDSTSPSPASTSITTGALPKAKLDDTTYAANTDFRGSVPKGGFTFGIIKNNIAAFVRALEQVTDTTVLANPKILTLNKQHGEVIVGRRDGYLTTTVTETSAVQSVEFLETGTQLRFRPFIGEDGYVRMEVHPEDSTGGLTAANLPFESTTEVTTNIILRDGHTILIGGLFREVTTSAKEQVPIAGNIPIAGALFRNSRDNTQREEVIILLTVHIVKDDDAMSEESQRVVEDIERYRVGMRKGLQWFGRERLAQAHYQWALEHMAKGHCGMAMWDLELAINNNPKFLAAIKLKEQLLDKREWDEESSSIRGFVTQLIMKEKGMIAPVFGRPGPPFEFPALQGPNGFDDGNIPKESDMPIQSPKRKRGPSATDEGASS